MNRSKVAGLLSGVVLAGTMMVSATAQAGWSANVAMTTDYRYRGISQNDEAFAIQGGFDYEHDSGFYAGVWGSSVDFQVAGDETSSELDIYGGFSGEFSNGLGWDVGVIRYAYPNTASFTNYEFTEIYGGLSYGMFSVNLARTGEFFGNTGSATYFNVAVDGEVGGFGIGASVGRQNVDNSKWGGPDWTDTKVYVSRNVGGFDLEAAWIDTNLSKTGCFGLDWCDSTLVLTVSKSFE